MWMGWLSRKQRKQRHYLQRIRKPEIKWRRGLSNSLPLPPNSWYLRCKQQLRWQRIQTFSKLVSPIVRFSWNGLRSWPTRSSNPCTISWPKASTIWCKTRRNKIGQASLNLLCRLWNLRKLRTRLPMIPSFSSSPSSNLWQNRKILSQKKWREKRWEWRVWRRRSPWCESGLSGWQGRREPYVWAQSTLR